MNYMFFAFPILIIAVIILAYINWKKKNKEQVKNASEKIVKEKSGSKNKYEAIYRIFRKYAVLNKIYEREYLKTELIYPADEVSLKKEVSKNLFKYTLITVIGILLSVTIAFATHDVFYAGIILTATFIILNNSTKKAYEKIEDTILEQFRDFISEMQHAYHDTPIVQKALAGCMSSMKSELGSHMAKILDILNSANIKYELDKYTAENHNKYFLTFLSLCASTKEYGDKKDRDGRSIFSTNLGYLKENIGDEILNRKENANAFKFMTGMALFPIILLKPLELWLKGNMPQLTEFYDGLFGTVITLGVFALSIGSYAVVTSLRELDLKTKIKEENIWARIASKKPIANFLNKIINSQYTKYLRINETLQRIGDHTGVKAFLLKKIVLGAVGLIVTAVVLSASTINTKVTVLDKYGEYLEDVVFPRESYKNSTYDTVKEYIDRFKRNNDITKEDIRAYVLKEHSELQIYADDIANATFETLKIYHDAYFKYWHLIVIIGVGFVMFMIPDGYLKFNSDFVEQRQRQEVIQFQNLILMLMYTDGTRVPVLLEWMDRFAFCFKSDLTKCRLRINHGQQKALREMKENCGYKPFANIIDNLMSVDKIGVQKAFDELATDRNYYVRENQRIVKQHIAERAGRASFVSTAPFAGFMGFYVILPMVISAVGLLKDMINSL